MDRQRQIGRRHERQRTGVGVDVAEAVERVAELELAGEPALTNAGAVRGVAPEALGAGGEEARRVVDRDVAVDVADDDAVVHVGDPVALDVARPAHALLGLEHREVDVVPMRQAVELVDGRAGGDEGGIDRRHVADDLLEGVDQILRVRRLEVPAAAGARDSAQEVVGRLVAVEIEADGERGDRLEAVDGHVVVRLGEPAGEGRAALLVDRALPETALAGEVLDAALRGVSARASVGEQDHVVRLTAAAHRRGVDGAAADALRAAIRMARIVGRAVALERPAAPGVGVRGAVVAVAVVVAGILVPGAARLRLGGDHLVVALVPERAPEAPVAAVVDRTAEQVAGTLVERARDRGAAGRLQVRDGRLEPLARGVLELLTADRDPVLDVQLRRDAAFVGVELALAVAAFRGEQERHRVPRSPPGTIQDRLDQRGKIAGTHLLVPGVGAWHVPRRRGRYRVETADAPLRGREVGRVVDVPCLDPDAHRGRARRAGGVHRQPGIVDDRAGRDVDVVETQTDDHVVVVSVAFEVAWQVGDVEVRVDGAVPRRQLFDVVAAGSDRPDDAPARAAAADRDVRGVVGDLERRREFQAAAGRHGAAVADAVDQHVQRVAAAPARAVGDRLDQRRQVGAVVGRVLRPGPGNPGDRADGVPIAQIVVGGGEARRVVALLGAQRQRRVAAVALVGGELDLRADDARPLRDVEIVERQPDDLAAVDVAGRAHRQRVAVERDVPVGDPLLGVAVGLRHLGAGLHLVTARPLAEHLVDGHDGLYDRGAAERAVEAHDADVDVVRGVEDGVHGVLETLDARLARRIPRPVHRSGRVEHEQHVWPRVLGEVDLTEEDLRVVRLQGGREHQQRKGAAVRERRDSSGEGAGRDHVHVSLREGRGRSGLHLSDGTTRRAPWRTIERERTESIERSPCATRRSVMKSEEKPNAGPVPT